MLLMFFFFKATATTKHYTDVHTLSQHAALPIEDAFVAQDQRDQQAAEAAVAVAEGVDGFELHVRERGLDQRRRVVGRCMQEGLERGQCIIQGFGRRRHEMGERRGRAADPDLGLAELARLRSEEHTSELQSLMRISYAVFCLKKKKKDNTKTTQK